MKRIKKGILLLIFLFTNSAVVYSQNLKIGYVDIFKIFNQNKKTQDYDRMLENERNEKEKLLEEKKEEIKKMQEKLSLLSKKEQEKQRTQITKKADEYRKMERQFFLDLKKERDEKMREIVEDINRVVKEYGKKNGYKFIFNKGAILYGEEGADLTMTILKIVNQNYKR